MFNDGSHQLLHCYIAQKRNMPSHNGKAKVFESVYSVETKLDCRSTKWCKEMTLAYLEIRA
jgi:hypothetical protein